MCVLNDLTDIDEDDLCDPDEKKDVESSSAPVKVEDLKEEVAGTRKIAFSFDIVHKDEGFISQLGSSCNDDIPFEDKVFVEVSTGLAGLTCTGLTDGTATTGYVKLFGGKRKVICKQDLAGITGDFEKKAHITLKYDYKKYEEKQVIVKHTPD